MSMGTHMTNSKLTEVKYVPNKNIEIIDHLHPVKEVKKSDTLFLTFTIATGLLTWIVAGGKVVWTSSAIIKLKSTDPNINPLGKPITTGEISLLVGLPGIISLPSSIIFTILAEFIGRKRCLQVICSVWVFGFIGLAFSNSLPMMISFLALMSNLAAGTMCIFPIYLTEICEDHNRAKYGCLLATCFFLGQLYTNSIGPLLSIRYYTLLVGAPLIPFLVPFHFAPETPVYLLSKGKKEQCFRVLKKLRNNKLDEELRNDLNNIKQNLNASEKSKKKRNVSKLFLTKEGRFGLLLSFLAMLFQMLSGGSVLVPLMAPIFQQINSVVSGEIVAVAISVLKVLSLFSTFFVIERIGRRPLLIVSSLGCGISMTVLGTFLYFQYIHSPLINQVKWLPFASILFYYVMFGIGLSPIPIPMISVLSHIELQSVSNSLVFTTSYLLLAICQGVYPLLAESIGPYWCMWIFAMCCFIGSATFYWLLPETKGKSYKEIQELLKNHRYFK